jgi:alditol oxidase
VSRSLGSNWAGTYSYRARELHRPASVDRLREIVARAPSVRVLGSRHSFTGIADADELVSLDALSTPVTVDTAAATVSLGGGVTYGALVQHLDREGLALHNLASLPHISVAGAVATATHGSGVRNGNLATAVAALEIVTSTGELVTASRGDRDFEGMVVGLGAIGVVTRLTLDVEPAFEVRQRVFEGLSWDALLEHFDEIVSSGYSVSVFTRWQDAVDQVWIKSRTDGPERTDLFDARPATVDRHPILELDPAACTHSWDGRARGRTACRTSGWASRPARGRRSSRSTCSRAGTPRRRSTRCAAWRTGSGRSCWCARSARWRPTPCG